MHILLVLVALLWLVPTLGLFLTSLFSPTDVNSLGWWEIFSKPSLATFQNYQEIWDNPAIHSAFFTTVWISVGGTILPIIVAALAGYAFAWLEFPGRDWLFVLRDRAARRAASDGADPDVPLYSDLGHLRHHAEPRFSSTRRSDCRSPSSCSGTSSSAYPKELLEAARIDGASEIRIFLRLILPLGLPAIASLAIFQFLWTWNDLLVALSLARDTQPLTVAIFSQLRQFGNNLEVIAPASFVSLVVPLAVFFAFQRYFVQGLLAGSVK